MNTLNHIEVTTKIMRCIQYRIAQKFYAGEEMLTLLPSLYAAICLYLRKQTDILVTFEHLNH